MRETESLSAKLLRLAGRCEDAAHEADSAASDMAFAAGELKNAINGGWGDRLPDAMLILGRALEARRTGTDPIGGWDLLWDELQAVYDESLAAARA